jgi:hypothetical protein
LGGSPLLSLFVRDSAGRFVKGSSGNPAGYPKAFAEVVSLARTHTEDAIKALADIVNRSKNPAARARAAEVLLNRGWGMAPQFQHVSTDGEGLKIRVEYVDADEWRSGAR